jgi:hypothetical protein
VRQARFLPPFTACMDRQCGWFIQRLDTRTALLATSPRHRHHHGNPLHKAKLIQLIRRCAAVLSPGVAIQPAWVVMAPPPPPRWLAQSLLGTDGRFLGGHTLLQETGSLITAPRALHVKPGQQPQPLGFNTQQPRRLAGPVPAGLHAGLAGDGGRPSNALPRPLKPRAGRGEKRLAGLGCGKIGAYIAS